MKKLPNRIDVRFPLDIAGGIDELVASKQYKNRSKAVRGLVELGLSHYCSDNKPTNITQD